MLDFADNLDFFCGETKWVSKETQDMEELKLDKQFLWDSWPLLYFMISMNTPKLAA